MHKTETAYHTSDRRLQQTNNIAFERRYHNYILFHFPCQEPKHIGGRDKKTPSITGGVSVKKEADYTKAGCHLISFGATINIIYLIQYQVNKSMKLA